MILNDGTKMPDIGFGTFQLRGELCKRAVYKALETGYRSIDTASFYNNEAEIGEIVSKSSIKREDLFITTKIWNSEQRNSSTYDAISRSLEKLKLEYIDMYLIHWPVESEFVNTWEEMIELKEEGFIKTIGVSNFNKRHIEDIIDATDVIPSVNQIEFHPYLVQEELKKYCENNNIRIESWSPLARKEVFSEDIIKELSKKYTKTVAQIIIRWHIDKGNIVIPKSQTLKRIEENYNIFDFKLEKSEISAIDSLNKNFRVGPDPSNFNF